MDDDAALPRLIGRRLGERREAEFPPGTEVAFERSRHRAVEQHVRVLEGGIEATAAGAVHRLAAGDCLHMRLAEADGFRNVGGRPARYAVILTPEAIA